MSEAKPTVVLVHGAFADASSWNGVIPRLLAKGLSVTAPPNPLRGIEADSAYIAAVLQQIEGPILAVGHSYGGAVITNAATDVKNVVGLVYVAAFAPDQGEILGEASADSKDSVLNSALVPRQYPTGDGGSRTEFSIAPAKVREAFASDLSDEDSRTHRNHAAARLRARILGLLGPAGVEGSPVVGRRRDRRQGARHRPGRSMAERAGAKITEVEGSHVIMISQPQAVTDVILEAVAAVGSVGAESEPSPAPERAVRSLSPRSTKGPQSRAFRILRPAAHRPCGA